VDRRLYLPEFWSTDPDRRELAGVPDDAAGPTTDEAGLIAVRLAEARRLFTALLVPLATTPPAPSPHRPLPQARNRRPPPRLRL
jgi:hypothetical protein